MKMVCGLEELIGAVTVASRAVSSRSSLSVLEGIFIKAQGDGKVYLTGNDLEIGIETVIEADVAEPGEIVLNAKMFGNILRSLGAERVSIETDEKQLALIKSGAAKFEIAGISASEFPDLPVVDSEYSIELPGNILRDMIQRTGFAVSSSDNNPILMGCLLEIQKTGLTMVALDGYRLAMRKVDMPNDFEEKKLIIPEKSLTELSRIIEDDEENIRIDATHRHAIFTFSNVRMVTRLIEGNYLNYQGVIPPSYAIEIKCDKHKLLESIQRASLIIVNDTVKSPVKFHITEGNINVSCNTAAGSVDDNIMLETGDSELEIGFYNRYLLEAVRAIEKEEIVLKLNTPTTPLVITPVEGDDFLYLILPLRINTI